MNRIFKVVWNRLRGQYMVADENCMSHGKGKTVLSLTLSALLALPGISEAGIKGVGGTTVKKSDNVYEVTTSNYYGKVGFNRFSKFNLPAKNIANLHHPNGTSHLVNFVSDQITIDGTVNSVLNDKIGGNLYFVTPTGFTVGATGVINAGSVTAAVVKSADFNKWYDQVDGDLSKSDFVAHNGALLTSFRNGEVPVNPNGVITVKGSINAGNGITLTAGKVSLGNGARLKTGVTDFKDLVNIKDGGSVIDSGITDFTLSETRDGSGDIVLRARADTGAEIVPKSVQATVELEGDATVEAKSIDGADRKANVIIESNVVAGDLYGRFNLLNDEFTMHVVRDGADVVDSVTATTKLGSGTSVSADGEVAIVATADNTMDATFAQELADDIAQIAWEMIPLSQIFETAAWAKLSTKSEVIIEQGALVTAGSELYVDANSKTKLLAEADTGFERLIKYDGFNYLPTIGAAVGVADSSANVTVDGTLKTGGDLIIDARNDLSSTVTAELTIRDTGGNPDAVALSFINGKAGVDISENATLDMTAGNGTGDLIIEAQQTSTFTTNAIAKGYMLSTEQIGFSVSDVDTEATVNLNTGLTGQAANVYIGSLNVGSSAKASTSVGFEPPFLLMGDAFQALEAKFVKGVLAGIANKKIQDLSPKPGLDDGLKINVAYTEVNYGQHANTNVNTPTGINATGNVTVTSSSKLNDHLFRADVAELMVMSGGTTADPKAAAFSALVTIMKDGGVTAETDIGNESVLKAGGAMGVTSEALIPYGRFARMILEEEAMFNQLIELVRPGKRDEISQQRSQALAVWEQYKQVSANSPGVSIVAGQDDDLSEVTKATGDYYASIDTIFNEANDFFKDLISLYKITAQFANFTYYSNAYVAAGTKTSEVRPGHAPLWAGSGAFAYNSLNAKAETTIGKRAVLTSGSNMTVSAAEQMENTLLAGYFPAYTSMMWLNVLAVPINDGNVSPIGATIGMQFLEGGAKVTVNEGAVLDSEKGDVEISADSETFSLGLTAIASIGDGRVAVDAMGNAIISSSASEVSVDDESAITSETKDVTLSADNKTALQSLAASAAWQSGQQAAGGGMAAAGIVVGEVIADVTVADNDGDESLYDLNGSIKAGGTFTAEANADTVTNAIGVALAGTAARSEGIKNLKPGWLKAAEKDFIGSKTEKLMNLGSLKIAKAVNESFYEADGVYGANSQGQQNPPKNPIGNGNQAELGGGSAGLQEADFQLDAAGSIGWNMVDVYSTVNIGAVYKTESDEQLDSKTINISAKDVDVSAFSDHWFGAWAGSGGLSLMGQRQKIESGYGVAGAGAVNQGTLATQARITGANADLADGGGVHYPRIERRHGCRGRAGSRHFERYGRYGLRVRCERVG